jgi:hypothetical protein
MTKFAASFVLCILDFYVPKFIKELFSQFFISSATSTFHPQTFEETDFGISATFSLFLRDGG